MYGIWVAAFTNKVEGPQVYKVILSHVVAFIVFFFDDSNGCRRCIYACRLMLFHHTPKGSWVRRTYGLTFEEDGSGAT